MRYQIYEAKSVKYDAQQRMGINKVNSENFRQREFSEVFLLTGLCWNEFLFML